MQNPDQKDKKIIFSFFDSRYVKNTAFIFLFVIISTRIGAQSLSECQLLYPEQGSFINLNFEDNQDLQLKRENCLTVSRWLGALAGSSMGVFSFYIGFTSNDIQGPLWKTFAIGIPTTLIGSWVGYHTTEWATRQIMRGEPKPGEATLKGVGYGLIDGAVIGVASMVPLMTIGYLTGGITFNEDVTLLKVARMATIGGSCFGGMIGFATGGVYGPSISLYLNF